MSTHARTNTVNDPIRWFMVGVATALVAVVLAAGLALAIFHPATQPAELGRGPAPASLLDAGLRLQRGGESGAGRATVSASRLPAHVLDLIDRRQGEIGAGELSVSGGSGLNLTDHRKGEIGAGETSFFGGNVLGLTDHRKGEINGGD